MSKPDCSTGRSAKWPNLHGVGEGRRDVYHKNQKEGRIEMQRNYSDQGPAEKISYQVVTSLFESYLLTGSFSSFLT